jgi:hypothetical protein
MTQAIKRGAVVNYHGSITREHGEKVVTGVYDDGRLVLSDRNYPDVQFQLRQVRQASVTPTGEIVELCEHCSHEYYWVRRTEDLCSVLGCTCRDHLKPGLLGIGAVVLAQPWQSGKRLDLARGYVVEVRAGELYPFTVWFPHLGEPRRGANGSAMYLSREEIDVHEVRAVADVPEEWVANAISILSKDKRNTWQTEWPPAAGLALSAAHRANLGELADAQ